MALMEVKDLSMIFGGITAIDNLALDVGLGMGFDDGDDSQPISAGFAVVYNVSEDFGLKLRTMATFGGEDTDPFELLFDVLPFFQLSPTMRAFCSVGISMESPKEGDAVIGWHLNPYLEIGRPMGPAFYAGLRIESPGGDDAPVYWGIPIGIAVSF